MLANIAPAPCAGAPEDAHPPVPSAIVTAAERARHREIASYLEAASITPNTLRHDTSTNEGIKNPINSSDPILTALVQLGALRLDCDRSFVSLIDGHTQYVVAEATRKMSLAPGPAAEGNDLMLGTTMLEASWGICPNTMNVFTDATGELATNTGNIVADKTRFIIRNLPIEPQYRDKGYVAGFPYMRSYYEVPLISPLGYVIGGYCVVDNKLRDFGEETFHVLNEVSSLIMAHLEQARKQINHSRSERLIRGLDTFIQEETNIRLSRRGSTLTSSSRSEQLEYQRKDSAAASVTSSIVASDAVIRKSAGSHHAAAAAESTQLVEEPASVQPQDETVEQQDMRKAFQRSAHLIRDAMNMDGMVFLDACPVGFASRDAQSSKYDHADPFESSPHDVLQAKHSPEAAPIFAMSPPARTGSLPLQISESLLHRCIRRYKQGHVFSADSYGVFEKRFSFLKDNDYDLARANGIDNEADATELFSHFPGAQSIIFLPMWHFQKERWFAAAIGWTSDPRISYDISDTTYLNAFANSITAEVLRLETLAVSRAKSDFISSISHELRSPLHGILATTELLRDTITSREDRTLLEMVSSSGTTLLDTMNHLLDHAKINGRRIDRAKKSGKQATHSSDPSGAVRACNLAELVEGVVQDVVMGHTRYTNGQTGLSSVIPDTTMPPSEQEPPPIVTIDIQAGREWNMLLEVGAWKRIILNLLGNALKYTPSGSIEVRLSQSNGQIVFAIQDTGIGMSSEYQKYHLYSPFRQENPLSVGTGLGLSIVQQIVDLQGGKTDVQSQKGVGTVVTVAVPIPDNGAPLTSASSAASEDWQKLKGRTLGVISFSSTRADETLLGPQQSLNKHREMLQASVTKVAENWLGMTIKTIVSAESTADVYLAIEPVNVLSSSTKMTAFQPLVEVHGSQVAKVPPVSAGTTLRIPFGPRRLAEALLDALEKPRLEVLPHALNGLHTSQNEDTLPTRLDDMTLHENGLPTPPEDLDTSQTNPVRRPEPTNHTLPPAIPTPRKPHVLIVDDNAINIRILATLLTRLSIPHLSATNGLEAMHLFTAQSLSNTPFDVVLMDVSMPVMDGVTATREIRAFESGSGGSARAKIVALTGLGSRESEEESVRCGMDGFLVKPVKMGVLRELLLPSEEA